MGPTHGHAAARKALRVVLLLRLIVMIWCASYYEEYFLFFAGTRQASRGVRRGGRRDGLPDLVQREHEHSAGPRATTVQQPHGRDSSHVERGTHVKKLATKYARDCWTPHVKSHQSELGNDQSTNNLNHAAIQSSCCFCCFGCFCCCCCCCRAAQVQKALKGLVVLSAELEAMGNRCVCVISERSRGIRR